MRRKHSCPSAKIVTAKAIRELLVLVPGWRSAAKFVTINAHIPQLFLDSNCLVVLEVASWKNKIYLGHDNNLANL